MTDISESDALKTLEKMQRREKRNLRAAHARGLLDGVCAMLRPDQIAIDLGANVGTVTEQLAKTGATVFAFEPDPYAFGRLSKSFGGVENVTLLNAAASTRNGTITLRRAGNFEERPRGASVKSTILEGGRGIDATQSNAVDVEMIDFPAWLEQHLTGSSEIAFLKMDIEGAELDLLEELDRRDLLNQIGFVVAETHERKFRDLRPRFRALRAAFAERYQSSHVYLDWI